MSDRSTHWLVWFAAGLAGFALVDWLLVSADWPLGWWLLGAFFICHGGVHVLVGMPSQLQTAAAGRRLGLTASETRAVTLPLVAVAAIGFMLAGMATVTGSGFWGLLVILSSLASLVLLGFYLSRQLLLGIAIDLALLAIVVTGVWHP